MHHAPGNLPLAGALRGTLPNPSLFLEDAGLALMEQVFGPRRWSPFSLLAQAAAPAASVSMDEVRAFTPRDVRPEVVQAGSNIAITRNAAGPIISASFPTTASIPVAKAGSDAATTALSPAVCPIVDTAFPTTPLSVTFTPNAVGDYMCMGVVAVRSDPVRLSIYLDGVLWTGVYHSNNGAANDVADVTPRADPSSTTGQPFYKSEFFFIIPNLSAASHTVEIRYAGENNVNQRTFLQRWLAVMRMDSIGNFVECTFAVTGNGVFTSTVTGQAWVTATSKLSATLFAVANGGTTEEMVMASGIIVGCKNRVAGVGFDVWAYSPQGFNGTITVHVSGGN